jgi:hypothetical protein
LGSSSQFVIASKGKYLEDQNSLSIYFIGKYLALILVLRLLGYITILGMPSNSKLVSFRDVVNVGRFLIVIDVNPSH